MRLATPNEPIDAHALELLASEPVPGIAPGSLEGFVGVFDSGVGGISVLKEMAALMPGENFAFFGDSAHAPYGSKPYEAVFGLSSRIAKAFVESGCKAIVIACNTATSTAADQLRAAYPQIPIIGIEPALKPAAAASHGGTILVMATEVTLRLEKFQRLLGEYGSGSNVIEVPCTGLADRIEQGRLGDSDLVELIDRLVGRYRGKVDSVVLGCTHYPFVKEQIRQVLGDVRFFDGNAGTAMQLMHVLERSGLRAQSPSADGLAAALVGTQPGRTGEVRFFSSIDSPDEIELYKRFFALPIAGSHASGIANAAGLGNNPTGTGGQRC